MSSNKTLQWLLRNYTDLKVICWHKEILCNRCKRTPCICWKGKFWMVDFSVPCFSQFMHIAYLKTVGANQEITTLGKIDCKTFQNIILVLNVFVICSLYNIQWKIFKNAQFFLGPSKCNWQSTNKLWSGELQINNNTLAEPSQLKITPCVYELQPWISGGHWRP